MRWGRVSYYFRTDNLRLNIGAIDGDKKVFVHADTTVHKTTAGGHDLGELRLESAAGFCPVAPFHLVWRSCEGSVQHMMVLARYYFNLCGFRLGDPEATPVTVLDDGVFDLFARALQIMFAGMCVSFVYAGRRANWELQTLTLQMRRTMSPSLFRSLKWARCARSLHLGLL